MVKSAPPTGDITAPTIPLDLIATAFSSSQINLSWTASTDNVGVTGYRIFRSGTQIGTSVGTSFSNTGLSASTPYSYTVAAYDAAGMASAESASASAATPAGTPPSCPTPANPNIYVAAADFSGAQGCRQWSYRDSSGANLAYDAANSRWQGSETYLRIYSGGGHPGNGSDAVRRWTASAAGSIRITGGISDGDGAGGDGVTVSIKKGASSLYQQTIANANATGYSYDVTTSVAAGDTIDFIINKIANNSNDSTNFNPTITFTPTQPPALLPPTILSPANGAGIADSSNKVTVSWASAAGATGYAVRMSDNEDSVIRDSRNTSGCAYVCIDSYPGTQITMDVRSGHTYTFWIHSRVGSGAYPGPSWSASNAINFTYTYAAPPDAMPPAKPMNLRMQ